MSKCAETELKSATPESVHKSVEEDEAAKLARLVYRMLRHGMKHVDRGAALYETQHRARQISYLKVKAATLGYRSL